MKQTTMSAKVDLTDRRARQIIGAVGVLSLCIFTLTLFLPHSDGHLVGSDGRSYYSILRSVVFDRDLHLANEYAWVGFDPKPLTVMGLPECPFAIGTSLLWLPFFLAAHLVSLLLNLFGAGLPTDGFGMIYEASVCTATIVYGTAGLTLTFKLARSLLDTGVSLWATLGMWASSPAIYYMIAEPSMSHIPSLFAIALFFATWYPATASRNTLGWIKLGLATGLIALVRWQLGLVVLIPLAELAVYTIRGKVTPARAFTFLLILTFTSLLVFSPQSAMWVVLYGKPLTTPQGEAFMQWLASKPWPTLVSRRHGLLLWHPIFLVALIGLVPLWQLDRVISITILAAFVVQLYINSAAVHWWADDAFGGRRFTSMVPLLTLSLAALLQQMKDRRPVYKGILGVVCLLTIWNGLSLVQFVFSFVSRSAELTWRELTVDRLLVPIELLRRYLG